MNEVVRIEPLANEAGLSRYECPTCCYVTSVLLQPKRPATNKNRKAQRKTPPRLADLRKFLELPYLGRDK
jgi:hypothetical protein